MKKLDKLVELSISCMTVVLVASFLIWGLLVGDRFRTAIARAAQAAVSLPALDKRLQAQETEMKALHEEVARLIVEVVKCKRK